MEGQLETLWNRIRDELRQEVPDFKFHIWLDPLEAARRAKQIASEAVRNGLRGLGAGAGPVDVLGLHAPER